MHYEDSNVVGDGDVPVSIDLSPRQQYKILFANLKKDSRYVIWALHAMMLGFGWDDAGLSGEF